MLQDGQVAHVQPILLTELYSWCCWRFNLAVTVLQQEQEVFYTIDVDPFGKRCAQSACMCTALSKAAACDVWHHFRWCCFTIVGKSSRLQHSHHDLSAMLCLSRCACHAWHKVCTVWLCVHIEFSQALHRNAWHHFRWFMIAGKCCCLQHIHHALPAMLCLFMLCLSCMTALVAAPCFAM